MKGEIFDGLVYLYDFEKRVEYRCMLDWFLLLAYVSGVLSVFVRALVRVSVRILKI